MNELKIVETKKQTSKQKHSKAVALNNLACLKAQLNLKDVNFNDEEERQLLKGLVDEIRNSLTYWEV